MPKLPLFAERFREAIGERTITATAEQLKLTRPTISLYANGQRIPDAEILKRICELCDVSSDWLLGLTDEKRPQTDLQAVCRSSGLNLDSISRLKGYDSRTVNALLSHEKFSDVIWYIRKAAENKPDYYNDDPDGEFLALLDELDDRFEVLDHSEARLLYIERAKTVLGDIIRGIIQ